MTLNRPDARTRGGVPTPPERYRGVNARLSPDNVPPGFVSRAVNMRFRRGEIEPRKGCTKPGWLNVTGSAVDETIRPVTQFNGAAVFKDPNGVEWSILCADGNVYRCRAHNERFTLALPTGVSVDSACVPVQAFNKVWLFRGKYLAPLVINDLDTGVEDIVDRWSETSVPAVDDEFAYGPFQAVSSLTCVSTLATVVTTLEHGYITGADITVRGAAQTEYNGRYNITVTDAYTFTYNFAGSATATATGTIEVSNQSQYWSALTAAQTVSTITRVGTTATATTAVNHGYSTGNKINITGAAQSQYNGTFTITVTGVTTFTYTMVSDPGASASGTLKAHRRPDAVSADWERVYNILPNADDALYINNRLLVPTAYTPSADSDPTAAYNSTSTWTKKDFIVATDVLDELHFDFVNEFRINQGSADEIVTLIKYNQDTVIVLKGSSWGVLSNIRLDLSSVTLDMRDDGYGACARAGVAVGKDVIFPAGQRGLVSITQNEQGKVNGTDIPFSDDVDHYVKRINWNLASMQRVAYWDDKLYWAVSLDDGVCRQELKPTTKTYQEITPTSGVAVIEHLVIGEEYRWEHGNESQLEFSGLTPGEGGTFTATQDYVAADGLTGETVMGRLFHDIENVNNAVLVYDFRTAAWCGVDTGNALCVLEFFKPTYNGRQRLAFIASDGWCNLMEDADTGDQVESGTTDSGQTWAEIVTDVTGRGLTWDTDDPKKFKRLAVVLSVWNARFTLTASTGAAFQEQTTRTDIEFSRTKYLKPFDKTPYVPGNGNGDHGTRGRGNYSVPVESGGVETGTTGLAAMQEQEVTVRASVRTLQHRFIQFRVQNDQGRCTIMSLGGAAAEGQNRDNVII